MAKIAMLVAKIIISTSKNSGNIWEYNSACNNATKI